MAASSASRLFPQVSEAAGDRPLSLRARPDLVIVPQVHGRDRYWLVKDPAALNYFHLREEEHALLQMLDGKTSLAATRRRFEAEFAPLRVSVEQIHAFVGRLHDMGLLLADAPGRASSSSNMRPSAETGLAGRPDERAGHSPPRNRSRKGCSAGSIPSAAGCSRRGFWAWECRRRRGRCAGLAAVCRLPGAAAGSPCVPHRGQLIWLMVALAAVKVLHELGHALTCKHFGGDCHEVGVLLLLFTPCLYCNVSDAWLFPGKWQRIAVSAARDRRRVFLASIATFLWWFIAPGLFHTLVPEYHARLFAQHAVVQRQPAASLRRLLCTGGPARRAQPRPAIALVAGRGLAGLFLGSDPRPIACCLRKRRAVLLAYGAASVLYAWLVLSGNSLAMLSRVGTARPRRCFSEARRDRHCRGDLAPAGNWRRRCSTHARGSRPRASPAGPGHIQFRPSIGFGRRRGC